MAEATALAIAAMLAQAQPMVVTPPAQAPAAPGTAAIVDHYNDLTAVTLRPGQHCEDGAPGDIIVCGGGKSDQRLPLPDERGPVIGPQPEPARAEANCLAASGRACQVCPPTGCTGVNLLAVPFKLFRIVRAIVDPEH